MWCVCELRWNEGLVVRQWSEVWDNDVASLTDSGSLQRDLGLAHLPLFITACIKCLESDKRQVTKMAATVVKVN